MNMYYYNFVSKPVPLTSTAIAYECEIYKYGPGISNKKIGSAHVQVNAYGGFDYSLAECTAAIDANVVKQLKEHCLQRAKIVFATGKEEEEEESPSQ